MKPKQLESISKTLAVLLIILFIGVMISTNVFAEAKPQLTPDSPDFFTDTNSQSTSTSASGDSSSTANVSGDTIIDMGSSVSIESPEMAYDHLGSGIACNKTTIGLTGFGQDSQDFGAAVTLVHAFGGQDCKSIGKLQKAKMRWQAIDGASKRITDCSIFHHGVTIHDDAHANLLAFRDFCKGVETHEGIFTAPANERVSNHRK